MPAAARASVTAPAAVAWQQLDCTSLQTRGAQRRVSASHAMLAYTLGRGAPHRRPEQAGNMMKQEQRATRLLPSHWHSNNSDHAAHSTQPRGSGPRQVRKRGTPRAHLGHTSGRPMPGPCRTHCRPQRAHPLWIHKAPLRSQACLGPRKRRALRHHSPLHALLPKHSCTAGWAQRKHQAGWSAKVVALAHRCGPYILDQSQERKERKIHVDESDHVPQDGLVESQSLV